MAPGGLAVSPRRWEWDGRGGDVEIDRYVEGLSG